MCRNEGSEYLTGRKEHDDKRKEHCNVTLCIGDVMLPTGECKTGAQRIFSAKVSKLTDDERWFLRRYFKTAII